MRFLFTFILFIFCTSLNLSAQIATFSGINSTNFAPTSSTPGIIVTNLVSGPGITSISAGGGCLSTARANVSNWPSSPNTNYTFSFTITANTGYSASISTVSLVQRRTAAGPTDCNIQIGSTNNVSLVSTTCATPAFGGASVNLLSGQSITITIFYWRPLGGMGGNLDFEYINVSGSVLPVEFSKFNTKYSGNTSILSFSTASETNNDFFTIERSVDGRNFDMIGEIKGAGNSNEALSYEFVDEKPLAGINYYRIKQTDFDGKYSYSEIKSVRHISKGNLTVTPRTTEGRLQVVTDIEDYSLEVFNASGQLVKSFTTLSADQSISIDELVAGLYFVRIHHGSEVETVKITKI